MTPRFSHAEMADEISKLVWSKRTWLEGVGVRRPAHEIETRKRELAVLEQAETDYRHAAQRKEV
jgi:hypothetical protein